MNFHYVKKKFMNEIREPSLLLTVNDYMKTIKSIVNEQDFIEQETLEDLLCQVINRDRDYMIDILQNDVNKLQKEVNQKKEMKNQFSHDYAITINQISLDNQKIRREIKEKNQLLVSKDNFKERKKQFQNLYDQFFFWYSQFQKTISEIKETKSIIKNEIQSLHAEYAAMSSNNLVILRHTNNNVKFTHEKVKSVTKYRKDAALLIEKEKYKRKIAKYKNKNTEIVNCFSDIVDILGKYCLDPKSFLLDLKRKTYEEQIAQEIDDDYPNPKFIAQMLKEKCDLAFSSKDNEISASLKEIEIKELHMKEKIHMATLNCGIPNDQNSKPKVYSPRFSPKRDPIDILINHKNLKFASWEESSKILNQTFNEIERLRQSRSSIYSILNSNDSFE